MATHDDSSFSDSDDELAELLSSSDDSEDELFGDEIDDDSDNELAELFSDSEYTLSEEETDDDIDSEDDIFEDSNDHVLTNESIGLIFNPFNMELNDSEKIEVTQLPSLGSKKGKVLFNFPHNKDITPLKVFRKFLTNRIIRRLLRKTNKRRSARFDARQYYEGDRGRKVTSSHPEKNREQYKNRFKNDFTETNFNQFMSCLLMMGSMRSDRILDNWKMPTTNQTGNGLYFRIRMKEYKFSEMYRCLNINVHWLQTVVNKINAKNYYPGTELSADESMIGMEMRQQPHHVNVPGKPDPNGTKEYTLADDYTFMYKFMMHLRTNVEPKDLPMHRVPLGKYVRTGHLPPQKVSERIADLTESLNTKRSQYLF